MEKKSFLSQNAGTIALGAVLLLALYITSLHSYLLFHSVTELFTIIVAGGIFVVAWNARSYINNNYLLFIGIASVFVALIDLIHTLAYKGMGVFPGDTSNLATQLWVAGRFLQCLSWLAAPFFLNRRLRLGLLIGVYGVVTGLLLLSILQWQVFPVAYVPGAGLTPFKVISEYLIAALFLAAIALLVLKRGYFDARVWPLVALSMMLTVASEIAFTDYVSVYGQANLIGHLLRWVACYFLYKAIIETGLVQPYAILLRDVKRSEDQLREYAASLNARNEDLQRAEHCLRDERTALQARNDELDAYAHTVAHDLKNPLAVIIATGDVLTQVSDLSHKELRDFCKQLKATAFEMNNIIDSLLLLSEVRKTEAPAERVDMGQVVAHVRKRLDYLIKQYGAHLVVPKEWPAAIGYGPWVEEVWANYISNALKYGGPSPRVELGATTETEGTVRFWTRDHGAGVPPDLRASLFTPFAQLRKIRKGSHGLGLSIVLRIVQKLGGQVGVESNRGKGSVFYFTLPAAT